MSAIETAQSIIDSLCDIRPEFKGKRVMAIDEVAEEDGALVPVYVLLRFDDGTTQRAFGLYAKVILAAKAKEATSEL